MSARERLESVVHKMRIRVLADVGGNKHPPGVKVLAIAANNIVLDIVEVWLAAGDTAWSWFSEQVLHSLSDEERNNQCKGKASPALLPLPELARDHGLARESTSGARTWHQGRNDQKNDDCRDHQSNHRQQADGNLFVDLRIGDAQVQQRERSLEGLDIVDAGANSSDESGGWSEGFTWNIDEQKGDSHHDYPVEHIGTDQPLGDLRHACHVDVNASEGLLTCNVL